MIYSLPQAAHKAQGVNLMRDPSMAEWLLSPKGQADSSRDKYVFSAGHSTARRARPEGVRKLSPGFTLVKRKYMFCPEGARTAAYTDTPIRPYADPCPLVAPSGPIWVGEITQGKPWAKLFWPLRATDWAASGHKDSHA
jgi:hypothetical protein